ncbi:hypothetical protein KC345_g11918 [Hortaea werneckii]|nr:hypothetical protein KC345_g11918 [Hortaea werneckii]
MINELHSFLNDLKEIGAESFNRIVGSGNALRFNPILCAKAEAAFGLPLTLGAQVEEAAVGAALCAAVGSGAISSFNEAGAYLGDPLKHSSGGDAEPSPTLNAVVRNRIMNSYGLTAPQSADTVPESVTDFSVNNQGINTGGVVDIWPGQAIGPLRLGMNAAELKAAAQGFPAFYKVEYDGEGLVNFIEIGCPAEEWSCRYGEIELFSMKAADLVDLLDHESPYDRQAAERGCTYRFPLLGLTLWRSSGLTEEDLLTEEYISMPPDILEDERRLLYFESVSIFRTIKK